ncbi:unnamed protein product [Arctogadus glacialis]
MAGKTLILEGLTADLDDQIKSKLSSYFQIKRRSGGGEISELYADPTDKRRVVLVYVDDKVRNEVLSRKTHQVDLKGSLGVVTLHVTLPEDVKSEPVLSSEADFVCNDEAKEDAALLRVTSERRRESLEMFFEQCIKDPILRKHGKNTWILQMSNKADMESVCASNLQQYGISVEVYKEKEEDGLVDRRRFVLSGLDDCCPSDTISMYIHSCSQQAEHSWEAVGGDSIVVTFEEDIDGHQFMQRTFTKRFNKKKIDACRLELTKSVIVQGDMSQISEEFLRLYFSNQRKNGEDIIKSFAYVNQNKSIVITFEDWKVAQRVAERKHTLMEKVLVAQLFYPDLQWVLTGQTHLQDNFSTDIAIPVTPDLLSFISRNEIFREELTSALQRVQAMVSFNIISKHPQLELKMSMNKYSLGNFRHGPSWETNARREVQTHLEKYIVEHIPMKAEVWQAVKGSCPEVNVATALISFKICSSELVVVGRWEEVETLVKEIKSKMEKASDELHVVKNTIEKEIQFDSKEMLDLTLDLVRDELSLDLQKFQNDHFSLDNIVAVVICGKESVTVLAKKGDIDRAENKLKEVIKQEALSISGEYNKEKFGEQWKTFNAELKKELEATQNSQNVLIEFSEDKIKLCGFRSVVDIVIAKVKGCLENKKVVTEDIPLKTLQQVEFVESFMKLSADPQLKALGVTVLPCRSPQSPYLKVTATSDQIKEAIHVVKSHIKTIATKKYMYSKAVEGFKSALESLGYHPTDPTKTKIPIIPSSPGASQTVALPSLQVSNTIVKIKGALIELKQGNITAETVKAIVNSTNEDVDLKNGVSGAILNAAGSAVEVECAKIRPLRGNDARVTSGGSLQCDFIIHIVGPNSVEQAVERVKNVLKHCEDKKIPSVSFPAIGTGAGGMTFVESFIALLHGIKAHFSKHKFSALKQIFLVVDQVKAMQECQHVLRDWIQMTQDTADDDDSNNDSSCEEDNSGATTAEKLIGPVKVKLFCGDITKEKTDAIVSSTNTSLNLNSGVSGAILKAAGKEVVDECNNLANQPSDGVVITKPGNLAAKHIIHMVGQTKEKYIISSMLKVFKICEDHNIRSVSFPALSTGR